MHLFYKLFIFYKKHIWETLRSDPVFSRPIEDPSVNQQKDIAIKRFYIDNLKNLKT